MTVSEACTSPCFLVSHTYARQAEPPSLQVAHIVLLQSLYKTNGLAPLSKLQP